MSLRVLHRWLGLTLAGLLLVISVTGVLLVWKPEYLRATIPEADEPLLQSTAQVALALDTIVSHYADGEVTFIQIHPSGLALYKAYLRDKRYAWHNQRGEQIQAWQGNERIEDWLLDLHHRFLLGNTVGLNMAGFSGLLMVPMVIVGLWLWWPRGKRFRLRLWPQRFNIPELLTSHSNLGALSAVPFLVIAFTGVILVYPAELSTLLLDDQLGKTATSQQVIQGEGAQVSTQAKLDYALALFPNSQLRSYTLPNQWVNHISVNVKQQNEWGNLGNTRVKFEAHRPTEVINARAQTLPKRLFDFAMPLHTGLLPIWYRLMLTGFGIALSLVVVFGVISFSRRRELTVK